jgi:hypothetical protein
MDLYTVSGNEAGSYSVCNPATGALYRQNSTESTGNAINAIFFNGAEFRDPRIAYNQFMMETECGTFYGTGAGTSIVSAAEIRPEVMPGADYLFAIERTATGYTMEMSGEFLYVGEATLRYSRNFVQDGKPIWHYNNSPEQYDGAFDQSLTFTGPFGEYTLDHTWPAGSAYPDYFIIGDPHTNFYEGNATIADIRLYVPGEVKGFYAPVDMGGVWNTVKGGSTVPLKFEVFSGSTELTSTSAVKSFTVKGVACPGALAATHDIELVTTGGTSLRYDSTAGHGQFIQNWQTPKKPGACYAVTMTTQAGSSVSANFWLK